MRGWRPCLFDDRAGDYRGLDAFEKSGKLVIGYQHKLFPSPLSSRHRKEIREALIATANAINKKPKLHLRKWILVTPPNLVSQRKDADVAY